MIPPAEVLAITSIVAVIGVRSACSAFRAAQYTWRESKPLFMLGECADGLPRSVLLAVDFPRCAGKVDDVDWWGREGRFGAQRSDLAARPRQFGCVGADGSFDLSKVTMRVVDGPEIAVVLQRHGVVPWGLAPLVPRHALDLARVLRRLPYDQVVGVGVLNSGAGVGIETRVVSWQVVEPGGEADDLAGVGRHGGKVGPPGLRPSFEVFPCIADGGAALSESAAAGSDCLRGIAGGLPLRLPLGFQRRGESLSVAGDDRFERPKLRGSVVRRPSRLVQVVVEGRNDGVTLFGDGDDVAQQVTSMLGVVEAGLRVGLGRPGVTQLPQDMFERAESGVALRLPGRQFCRVGGAEVGAVTGEDGDPLFPRVGDRVGDEVSGVGGAAAGHAHVGRRRAGVLPHGQVPRGGGVALHTVHRAPCWRSRARHADARNRQAGRARHTRP